MNQAYRDSGVNLPNAPNPLDMPKAHNFSDSLILAPPSALGTPWMQRFKTGVIGRASGWMRIRGRRRRLAVDRGFVLSDHADWPGLLGTIAESQAERVIVTHGYTAILSRYLLENGLKTKALSLSPWGLAEDNQ
jgi:putative mRNA 3-end processing factor